jgi:hypothetical protein
MPIILAPREGEVGESKLRAAWAKAISRPYLKNKLKAMGW